MKQQNKYKMYERNIVLTEDQKKRLASLYQRLDSLNLETTLNTSSAVAAASSHEEDLDKTKVINAL